MKLYLSPETERDLRKAVSQNDVDGFVRLVSGLKGGRLHWLASQLLLTILDDEAGKLLFWADSLASRENPQARICASWILLKLWEKDRDRAEQMLTTLTDDQNWIVRETAHSTWCDLLKAHFQQIHPILKKWSTHSSVNLRRCVAIAARSAGNLRKQEWADGHLEQCGRKRSYRS